MGAQFQHDHIVHFYHLHALDWVDIVSALEADPKKTAVLSDNVSKAPWGGTVYFKSVQERIKAFVGSGQLGPFSNAYWGHPEYKLTPEANLMAAAHYIEAIRLQARAARMHAIFGGKNPHPQSLVVGGVTCVKDLTPDRIAEFLYITKETQEFIKNVNKELGTGRQNSLRLSNEKQDIGAGFILRRDKIKNNVSLNVLLAQTREQLETELAKGLFASRET